MNKSSRSFPVYATANKTITLIIRTAASIWLLAAFLLGFLLPVAFASDEGYAVSYSTHPVGTLIFVICYELCFFFLCRWLVKLWQRRKDKAVIKMWVDEKGLHRRQKDGIVLSVLYSKLRCVPKEGNYDVYTRQIGSGKYSRTALMANYMNEKGDIMPVEVEFNMNVWYGFFPGNIMELRAAFFQNMNSYREIRINPDVYIHYNINPDTFQFEAKKYWIRWTVVALLIISAWLVIMLLTVD